MGYGLTGQSGLTLKSVNVLKSVDKIFFENYTNYIDELTITELTTIFNKEIITVPRKTLEEDSSQFIKSIIGFNVALLISGDPFIATTHYSIVLEALQKKIDVQIINNVSIYNVIPSITGLSAYKFGRTCSITFPENYSLVPYNVLKENLRIKAHTLMLLDINVTQNEFLDINSAINQLRRMEEEEGEKIITDKTLVIGIAHIGSKKSQIFSDTLKNIEKRDWNVIGPPQALIIPGKLHFMEEEILSSLWGENGLHPNFFGKSHQRIVVTGSFDIIHPGHLYLFQEAKKKLIGAELIVVLARDSSIREFKDRDPILPENHRRKVLESLSLVDKAILGNEEPDKIKIIEDLNPDLLVLGYDQWISEDYLRKEFSKRNLKTKVIRLEKFEGSLTSSSEIRKRIASKVNKNNS